MAPPARLLVEANLSHTGLPSLLHFPSSSPIGPGHHLCRALCGAPYVTCRFKKKTPFQYYLNSHISYHFGEHQIPHVTIKKLTWHVVYIFVSVGPMYDLKEKPCNVHVDVSNLRVKGYSCRTYVLASQNPRQSW